MLKYSRQREALLENIKSRYDHPTADALYRSLRDEYPKMSLGTVYRNLALLCENGDIQKINCGDGQERYDCRTVKHNHFICSKCGKIIDIFDKFGDIDNEARSDEIGEIVSHSLVFYGKCRDCYKEK